MPYQTGILEALRDWGLTVVESSGCRTRGSESFDPFGHVVHHDVIRHTESLPGMLITGSTFPGPLCNFWLPRSGKVHVVALGRANHAGTGSWNGLNENREVWGTEMNNLGTSGDPWPEVQLDAMARIAACTADFSGFPVANVCGHKEWTSRKVDPHSIFMPTFRHRVGQERMKRELSADDRARLTVLAQRGAKTRPFLTLTDERPWMGEQGREGRARERRHISDWQTLIDADGTDGIFGPGTSRATAGFQRAWRIHAEGDVTEQGVPKLGSVDRESWELALFFGLLRFFNYG